MTSNDALIAGIDLGTTYSCLAVVDESGKPATIRNREGQLTTPSVVFYESPANIVVGETARNALPTDPDRVVSYVKRLIGRSSVAKEVDGRAYRPEEVSAAILRKLASDASEALGQEVKRVVITVPAYFGENERAATKQAGAIAGLDVKAILDEPSAAAIAYGVEKDADQTVLVYDLGGGTFDVTLVTIEKGHIAVRAKDGDHDLGGKDWDEKVMSHFVHQWALEKGRSPEEILASLDAETLNKIRLDAERCKRDLSTREQARAAVLIDGEVAKVQLTREKFNEITADLLARADSLVQALLEEGKRLGVPDFDKILLVGGSTRMPQVMDGLAKYGRKIEVYDPDEAVAKGAAIFAQKLMVDEMVAARVSDGQSEAEALRQVAVESGSAPQTILRLRGLRLTTVTSRAFGVVALDAHDKDHVVFLIPRNREVPVETTQQFGTRHDHQPNVLMEVMEGTDDSLQEVAHNSKIGEAVLDLPPGMPAGSPIEVTFRMNAEGLLEATARETKEGRTVTVTINRGDFVMRPEEVKTAREAMQHMTVS